MSNGFSNPCLINQRAIKTKGLRPAVDAEQVQPKWTTQFEELEEPRGLQGREHAFLSIMLIAIKRHHWRSDGGENCMRRATKFG